MNEALTLPNLPQSVGLEVLRSLRATLPPPVGETDEARAAREEIAMGAVAALQPANCFEALLAADIVAAEAHAMDSLRAAVLRHKEPDVVRRHRAEAAMMGRMMQSGLRGLQRTQAIRAKAEASAAQPDKMEKAGWWFRDASVPEAVGAPEPDKLTPPPAEPVVDIAVEAERYAVIYPARAALIRAHGGLPPRVDFGPPEAELVAALVSGTSPTLLALDRQPDAPSADAG